MKLAVVGSRSFDDFDFLKKMLSFHPCTQLISGGAKGADTLAKGYSAETGIPIKEFLPDWEKYGKRAGYLRNTRIVEACDEVVAFWDGASKGTAHTIKIAKDAGKTVHIYWPPLKDPMEGIGI